MNEVNETNPASVTSDVERVVMCFNCPQCGEETEQLYEGYCKDCCDENQNNLDCFNARHDWWNSLTQQQKDEAIKRAYT
jgi:hypothetical protein